MLEKIINFVKDFFASAFIKRVSKILIKTIQQIGQEKFNMIRAYVIEVGTQSISGEEKMKRVIEYTMQLGIGLKESAIRALVENIVQDIKNGGK